MSRDDLEVVEAEEEVDPKEIQRFNLCLAGRLWTDSSYNSGTLDFNKIPMESEKKGGASRRSEAIQMFRDTVKQCNLQDIDFTGYPFTWSNGGEGEDNIQERLDCFLASEDWLNMFPSVKVTHEQRSFSDHCPVLSVGQELSTRKPNYNRCTFKFEEVWTKETEGEDRWLAEQNGGRVWSPKPADFELVLVSDLIDQDLWTWNK